jgi:hypothetical protein
MLMGAGIADALVQQPAIQFESGGAKVGHGSGGIVQPRAE